MTARLQALAGDVLLQGKDGSFALQSDKKIHTESQGDYTINVPPSRASGQQVNVRSLDGPACERGEAGLVEAVRLCAAHTPVAHDAEVHHHVLDQGRLVHLRGREPREPRALGEHDHLGLLLGRRVQRSLGDLAGEGHEPTPIWTPRKRDGAAPCDTCAPWPGWPLPQFVRP
jgi:hypothetical protein